METRQFRKTSYISQKKFISSILGNLREAYFTKLQWKRFHCISMAQYVWTEWETKRIKCITRQFL